MISAEATDSLAPEPGLPDHGSRQLLAYLQLIRAPNGFTAIADIAAGFLVVGGSYTSWSGFVLLALASVSIYTAGMVLNDVFDYSADLQTRPERPLPSGRISLDRARMIGYGLLVVGVALGAAAGFFFATEGVPAWRSAAVAVTLAAAVWLYDGVLKETLVGPLLMASCRFLNVLLGMSLGAHAANGGLEIVGYGGFHLALAGGIGVYILGVTWFARNEDELSSRVPLVVGLAIMASGIALLGAAPRWALGTSFRIDPELVWPAALCLLTVSIFRRCLLAIVDPQPRRVQAAVKQCILSLIVLDAAIVLLAAPWFYAVAVLALLVPTLVLGKWVYST